jgi:hypothetical protein
MSLPAYQTANTIDKSYILSGIRTREPSNRAAADIQLRWHGYRDWHCTYLFSVFVLVNRKKYGSLLTITVGYNRLMLYRLILAASVGRLITKVVVKLRGLHVECLLFLCDFNRTRTFLVDFGNPAPHYKISGKSVHWELSCSIRTDGQT